MGNTLTDAVIVFLVTLFAFYVFEMTFGAAYDAFFNGMMNVESARPFLTSPIMNLARQFHKVVLVILIASCLWVVRTIIQRMSYSRTYGEW